MKIIHTADLHLGQILYQNYDRVDEHEHFFSQLSEWCKSEKPDALVVSGDIYDIQQPSANTRKFFTDHFVRLHMENPSMKIVITAGNHDSASRIQADSAVWEFANAKLVGLPPSADLNCAEMGWQDDYIVSLDCGFIIALPYMSSDRKEHIQSILDRVASLNTDGKPVVMMAHSAVTGLDPEGHEVGNLKLQEVDQMGTGYDYLALGHIHKPQTIGHAEDMFRTDVTYPSGAIRYSGSALHVSCDEKYPHSVSVVEINRHGGDVHIRQLVIDELRHFTELPQDGSSFRTSDEAIAAVTRFCEQNRNGYIRLRIDQEADLPANFCQMIYDELAKTADEVRFNPKHIWTGTISSEGQNQETQEFEVAELQQMTDPVIFIEKTADQYPDLNMDEIREAFIIVREEMERMKEEKRNSEQVRADRKKARQQDSALTTVINGPEN